MIEIAFPDQWPERLAWLTALTTLLVGLTVMVMPRTAMKFLGFAPLNNNVATAASEIRGAFGGVFAGLGVACLLLEQPFTYFALGLAFAFAFIGRLISIVFDRGYNTQCLIAALVELIGACFTLYFSGQALGLIA